MLDERITELERLILRHTATTEQLDEYKRLREAVPLPLALTQTLERFASIPAPMGALFAFAKKAQAEATAAGITLPMTEAALDGCTWGDPKAREGTTIYYFPKGTSTGFAWRITGENGNASGNTAAAAVERARANGVAV